MVNFKLKFLFNYLINMKHVRHTILLFALVSFTIFMSCGPEETTQTEGEKLIEALSTKTWSVDASASNVTNVTGSPDVAATSISISTTTSGASFTFSGGIGTYISGGSFSIAENGSISGTVVSAKTTDITVSTASVNVSADYSKITVTATTTQASGRTTGVGSYTVVFVGN